MLHQVILTMSTCLKALSCCFKNGCLHMCVNKQLNRCPEQSGRGAYEDVLQRTCKYYLNLIGFSSSIPFGLFNFNFAHLLTQSHTQLQPIQLYLFFWLCNFSSWLGTAALWFIQLAWYFTSLTEHLIVSHHAESLDLFGQIFRCLL